MPQQSDPTPRATRPLTPTHAAYPVERAPRDSAVLRAIPGARMRAKMREMRAAVTRMAEVERAAVTEPLPPASRVTPRLSQPAPRAIPRFAVGEVVSHPRSRQIGRIGGPPRPWSTALKWPVHWLRNVRGKLCWTHWYTEVWQGELESIQ